MTTTERDPIEDRHWHAELRGFHSHIYAREHTHRWPSLEPVPEPDYYFPPPKAESHWDEMAVVALLILALAGGFGVILGFIIGFGVGQAT